MGTQSLRHETKKNAPKNESAQAFRLQPEDLLNDLSKLVVSYLEKKPHLSLMALSQRCDVSEPTLRRIKSRNFKSLPTPGTVLKFLTYISQETAVEKLIEKHPGPIAHFLKDQFPDSEKHKRSFDDQLHQVFESDTNYLVYKLCCQTTGVSMARVKRVFGDYGHIALRELQQSDFIKKKGNRYYAETKRWLSLPPERLPAAMKALLSFVKYQSSPDDPLLTPIQANYSAGVSVEAYREVTRLQRECLKKIRDVLGDQSSQGDIPLFLLLAIDTLDSKMPNQNFADEL